MVAADITGRFNEVGFPGVRIMETNEHYDRQHQDLRQENDRLFGDVLSGVDFDYAASVTALNVVSLAALAGAPAPPEGVSIEGQVSADTTLRWQRVPVRGGLPGSLAVDHLAPMDAFSLGCRC